MSTRHPARRAARWTTPAVYGRRRRRALLGGALAVLLAYTAFGAGRRPHEGSGGLPNDGYRTSVPAVTWPAQGQAALALGDGPVVASPDEQPVPIASLAKVMTAYVTLERYPLSGAQDGFTLTVSRTHAHAEDQSVVAVQAGEQLTERQLLEALLVPSGNNIAWMLAARVAGSEAHFIAEMNAAAGRLGMDHTTYTDPSGFAPSTVSSAADQLRVFRRAMGFSVFRQIVAMPSVTLPVAGRLENYDPLIGQGYAGKTGSDSAAGGCFAFSTQVTIGGRQRTAIGVVMGQGQGSDTTGLLAAAGDAATRLAESVAPTSRGLLAPDLPPTQP